MFLKFKIKLIVFAAASCVLFISLPLAHAQLSRADHDKFEASNFDEKKYEFVNDYLLALDYLKKNEGMYKKWTEVLINTDGDQAQRTKDYIDYLKKANVHFRIAKNILNKHDKSKNGLILKSVEIFNDGCNKIVDINNEERKILSEYSERLFNESIDQNDETAVTTEQKRLSYLRKEANKMILESAMYLKLILISNVPNRYGEFVRLAITGKERDKLIFKIQGIFGEQSYGEVREGQSFLEASVSVIREILEDYSWLSKDS